MAIDGVRSLPRFVGSVDDPLQVVRVGWASPEPARLVVRGDDIARSQMVHIAGGGTTSAEIGVRCTDRARPGDVLDIEVVAELPGGRQRQRRGRFEVAEPGWRMFMVSHFHYDPVWWNTQAFYTETWEKLPREQRPWEGRRQQPAFTLIDAHLDEARRDPDYRFVLAELDYLKPYWDTFPWRRDELLRLLADGRLELMGGMYNEPNTNLTSAESTTRSAAYGIAYQREVLGGDPATAWQLDVFGHDPQFPGMMADAGLTSSSWARGPFHQWGPSRSPGGNAAMQFASEFDWVAPSGRSLLTSYMPNHYSAGWEFDKAPDLDAALEVVERLFLELQPVAATRNVLLPVGSDYTPPNRWLTEVARAWGERYVWPRFEVALPREFFAAVRAELVADGRALSPQTRDMNPVYTGKDVSYIDTKQAQRAGECVLLAAERFATFAAVHGARYPTEALDKAWRQLLFGAHHDGITGTESDQVYLDLLGGWRDTYELATAALDGALEHLGALIEPAPAGRSLVVFNALSWARTDLVRCRVELDEPAAGIALADDDGRPVDHVLEHVELDEDGRITVATLAFVATSVPSVGYRRFQVVDDPAAARPNWEIVGGTAIENATYRVVVDPARGGAITSLVDRRTGRELLSDGGLANEVIAYDEYPTHPEHGEGPWHLTPTGTTVSSATQVATVTCERGPIGQRLLVDTAVAGTRLRQEIALYEGVERVICTTDLDGFDGQDTLFRMRVAAAVPGGRPIAEVGHAVIGRSAGFPDVDVARSRFTLDNPAYNWFGVGASARVDLVELAGSVTASRAIGVAEVVAPDHRPDLPAVRDLVTALVRAGVTSTVSHGGGTRYGHLATDSNLPDVRIVVAPQDGNRFLDEVLAAAGTAYEHEVEQQLARGGMARVWVPAEVELGTIWAPDVDLRDTRALPVLLLVGTDDARLAALVQQVTAELEAAARIDVEQPGHLHPHEGSAPDGTLAVLNRGLPGSNVDISGNLYLSLMRSCSGWPSGVWLDPPRRTVPDGSSFQFQHWSHRFEYAIVGGSGDWRQLGLVRAGQEHNDPLRARLLGPVPSTAEDRFRLPPRHAFLHTAGGVVVSAVKPAGNPAARMADPDVDPADGITVRCYEPHGHRVDAASLRTSPGVRSASRADLLERPSAPLTVRDGGVELAVAPYEIVTVQLRPDGSPTRPRVPAELGHRCEPAQPVFGDYWLHNKGAAPLGYQPVTVRTVERAIRADGAFDVHVAVASQRTDAVATGLVALEVPVGWTATPARWHIHLAPGAYDRVPVRIAPADDAAGRYFVAAQLDVGDGQLHEDVTTIDIGRPDLVPAPAGGERRLLLERATRSAAVVTPVAEDAEVAAMGAELRADLLERHLEVVPGGGAEVAVRLHSLVAGSIRGEAQLISPWGTWDVTSPWTTGFEVPGGGTTTVRFRITCPRGTPRMSSWALVKVMYFGRLHYTDSVSLRFGGVPAGGTTT